MIPELRSAVERLYEVFAPYGARRHMPGSPNYGDLDRWNETLFSTPLRALTSDNLLLFAGKAITTWGEVDDLKHYLPRMLELCALFDPPYEISIVFRKLDLAEWCQWPAPEQEAIGVFLRCLWAGLMQNGSSKAAFEFDQYFATIAHSYPDFTQLLQVWEASASPHALKHLAAWVYSNAGHLFAKDSISDIFKTDRVAATQLQQWLLAEPVLRKLTDGYFRYEKEPWAEEVSIAEQLLRQEANARAAVNKSTEDGK